MDPLYLNQPIGRVIRNEGKDYLYFSGTSYLGMQALEEFRSLVKEEMDHLGLSHGLSRVNNVRLGIYDAFESYFAQMAGSERALAFSSGFLAGYAIISHLEKEADIIFIAPGTHPAVFPNALAGKSYGKAEDWINAIQYYANQYQNKSILILANAVDALKPEIHDFSWMSQLPKGNQYTLLIDDSHAFGLVGEGVFGTYALWKDLPVRLFVSGSLGKGLGLPAGIVLGNQESMQELSSQVIFRGASPPPPAYLSVFLKAQALYSAQFDKLRSHISLFNELTVGLSFFTSAKGYPVFSFREADLVSYLFAHQFIVSSFPYPRPSDQPIHRVVLSAWHEEADLILLAETIKKFRVT
ncbi:7-keto-8-aminopelargonate synthetase [Belliella buryatensis]|uniref:7-keto-8-aminopelargonate synthetase n=1 Tax=Belliella buryatensis TaxID=1500549 RepID=A0A239H497_9BACT|nr:aminotransferase class I/II-fold pyridoxal phosphate-dependent enzyme [Belliella buryatensis]SNS76011.1 7-keto-8-aminopelargonate synthetase [Belliella buryatensis]